MESATFSLSEATLGLIPATISPYVVKCLGESNARRMMLNARRFSAREALELGLLHKVVSDDKLDVALQRLQQQADLKLLELEQKMRG